jgi:hypothetical protein
LQEFQSTSQLGDALPPALLAGGSRATTPAVFLRNYVGHRPTNVSSLLNFNSRIRPADGVALAFRAPEMGQTIGAVIESLLRKALEMPID